MHDATGVRMGPGSVYSPRASSVDGPYALKKLHHSCTALVILIGLVPGVGDVVHLAATSGEQLHILLLLHFIAQQH